MFSLLVPFSFVLVKDDLRPGDSLPLRSAALSRLPVFFKGHGDPEDVSEASLTHGGLKVVLWAGFPSFLPAGPFPAGILSSGLEKQTPPTH